MCDAKKDFISPKNKKKESFSTSNPSVKTIYSFYQSHACLFDYYIICKIYWHFNTE